MTSAGLYRLFFGAILVASATSCALRGDLQPTTDDVVVISIVGSNDVHGQFLPSGNRGGITTLSGYVSALRKARANDGGVLLVDGGDMWQGTLESNLNEGALMVEAYNALGYAAATIGNHEFDFGPEGPLPIPAAATDDPQGNLKQRASEAAFPLLAANLIDEATGQPVAWENVRPTTMVDVAGINIGIIGILTASTPATTISANIAGLRIAPLAETIIREATRLRADGASLIVVAAHAGGLCEDYSDPNDLSSCDLSFEILQVASVLPPGLVDHIVGGHEPFALGHIVNGIAVTAGTSYARDFGRADFTVDRASGEVLDVTVFPLQPLCPWVDAGTQACSWDAENRDSVIAARYEGFPVVPDPEVAAIARQAAAVAKKLKSESLGVTLAAPFTLQGNPESSLGNLITDILQESLHADISMLNVSGGLRADLPAGELTYGSVFEMFPFDNRVVMLELSGADLREVIAQQAHNHQRRAGISGMSVDVSCTDDRLDVAMRLADGGEVANDDRILVAVNDFLSTGGDGILTPVIPDDGLDYPEDPRLVRDVIADWFRRSGTTLHTSQFSSEQAYRWNVPASLPATCRL
jgi:2',3'-cyclic-nucleotide 2'-phosphodiesterase (5'-nucleotidase family)